MIKKLDISPLLVYMLATARGRETPNAMSLCYADTEPPRFAIQTEPPLYRPSLRYAVNKHPPYKTALY